MFRQYINNEKLHSDCERLQSITTILIDCLKFMKGEITIQLSTKQNNPSISVKTYWFILEKLLNGKKILTIPTVISLFQVF